MIYVDGRRFKSLSAAAIAFNQHPSRVHGRLREGWTLRQALKLDHRARRNRGGRRVTWKGVMYRSLKDLSEAVGVPSYLLVARLGHGWSLRQAIAGRSIRRKGHRKPIEFRGRLYQSCQQLAARYRLEWSVVSRRLKRGWSMAQALGIETPPPRFRDAKGRPRRTKWVRSERKKGRNVPKATAGEYKLYLVTNDLNGKEYVGITTMPLGERLKQHFAAARSGRHNKLSHAIRKYGEHRFSIRLLKKDARDFIQLERQEVAEIRNRQSITRGYNSATGGSLSTSKTTIVAGRHFESRAAAATHYGIDVAVFNLRLSRLGWTPEQAAGLEKPLYSRRTVQVGDVRYKSLKSVAAARGLKYGVVHSRVARGWTEQQALGLEPPPDTMKFQGVRIRVGRRIFPSYASCARHFGVNSESFRIMVAKRGLSPAEALKRCGPVGAGRWRQKRRGVRHKNA